MGSIQVNDAGFPLVIVLQPMAAPHVVVATSPDAEQWARTQLQKPAPRAA